MDALIRDVGLSCRSLLKSRGFTTAAVLTMALGIGITTVMFSVVHNVLLSPLPYPQADRLLIIWKDFSTNFQRGPLSPQEVVRLRTGAPMFQSIGGVWPVSGTLVVAGGKPEPLAVGRITSNFLTVLGVPPAQGRAFTVADEEEPATVIISHGLWQARFGGADVLGKRVQIDGGWGLASGEHTIIGIMPPEFEMLLPRDANVPRTLDAWVPFTGHWSTGQGSALRTVGRLAPGVQAVAADTQVRNFSREAGPNHRFYTMPLHTDLITDARPALMALQVAVGFVLLITCISIAGLMLVRAQRRRTEMAIRTAMGALPGQLARLVLVESVLLALAGGALGVLVAYQGLWLLPLLDTGALPRRTPTSLSGSVLLFALAASLGSGLLFGLGPLVAVWRGRFESALKTNDRTASGTVSMRARSLLVLVEIGLSVVLLIGAGLLVRTFQNLHTFNPGFDASNVLTFQLSIPSERYQGSDGVPRFTFALEQQLRAIPGVEAAGAINLLPLDEREPNFALPFWTRRTVDDESPAPLADTRLVTPGYFDTLRSELLAGRWFDETDDTNHPPAVIIDDRFARQAWPGQDPLGQELQLNVRDKTWRRVVGVIRHIRQHRLSEEVREQVFLPLAQWPRNQLSVVVRAPLPPDQLLPAISQQIASLDPHMAPARVRRLADLAAQSRAPARFSMVLGSLFAACSLLLTCLSLYGVISYSVVQRTPEFGVRAALGASRRDLLRLVLRQGLGLILAGSVVGLIGAGLVMRSLRSLLFGVTAFDPLTFVIVPIAVALTALAACYAPARRASQVDPLVALRNE